MDKPNILLITDDQHRWDFMQDADFVHTPNITRLGAEGVTLTNAYSNCPICMPTRFTWLYGLYASQASASLLANAGDWPTHLPSMAAGLQKEGYRTAIIGKLHSLGGLYHRDVVPSEYDTKKRGFHSVFEVCGKSLSYWYDCRWTRYLRERNLLDRYREDMASRTAMIGGKERFEASFLSKTDHMDGFIGREVRRWLEAYRDERPFFLHASFCGPHFPLDPPEEFLSHYRPEDMPLPVQGRSSEPQEKQARMWQEHRALYCGLIEHVDHEIGQILALLDRTGRRNDTLVIFTTDHGDMIGDLGLNHKGLPYDGSCRTPVILWSPEMIEGGGVLQDPAEAVDLPCTILEAAGAGDRIAEYLPSTPGRSFWHYARGLTARHRDWAYAECRVGRDAWRMCRDRQWKYVYCAGGEDMLFDLREDPREQNNLAGLPEHGGRIGSMRSRVIQSMTRALAPDPDPGVGTYSRRDL